MRYKDGILILILILSLLLLPAAKVTADTGPLGWEMTKRPPVSLSEAMKIRSQKSKAGAPKAGIGLTSTEITYEIRSLARSLKYDVNLIYRYVHDHIEYTPYYGSKKGAMATLLDESGNDFDQSSLMIALLRESGYTANFVYGGIRLYPEQLEGWLGADDRIAVVAHLLWAACIPCDPVDLDGDDRVEYIDLDHVWVKVDIGGSDYVFDPSFKMHSFRPAIDLASAMDYDQNGFLSRALSGATVRTNFVRNINRANIDNDLANYATNLVNHIKSERPAATLEDIIRGKTIVPVDEVPRQAALPNELDVWEEFEEFYEYDKTKVRIEHLGIDITLYAHEFYGKRLTIYSNPSYQPVLRLDGGVLAIGESGIPGEYYPLTLSIDHPYLADGGQAGDQSRTLFIRMGGVFSIMNGWGKTGRKMVEIHRKRLKSYLQAGWDETSEPVLGETLAMIGYDWLAETTQTEEIASRIANIFIIRDHSMGVCGQEESYSIDIPLRLGALQSGENDSESVDTCFQNYAGHGSAFEFGVIEQTQPVSAVSTVKLLDIANSRSDKIFNATASNYYSHVRPNLFNYSSSQLGAFDVYIENGYELILSQNGMISQNRWTGTGYISIFSSSSDSTISYTISGNLNGGYADEPMVADSTRPGFLGRYADGRDNPGSVVLRLLRQGQIPLPAA